jgi:NADH-quinone oxidoreductase subunit E
MLRRLAHDQPESFAFTPANRAWAEAQISKFPAGRQASAIIPILWRAQEQEGWLSKPAIEHVADLLGLAYIRALEVATFYFMFQLHPVGKIANIQVCGTLSCMICGAEDLMAVCKEKIAPGPHQISADGNFSWEEVECLGACANAPMAQIGKDYYEDLTAERLGQIIDELGRGKVPVPGPQAGRYASEPLSGLTSLKSHESGRTRYNASVQLATDIGDTVKRIDGTEVALTAPWQGGPVRRPADVGAATAKAREPKPGKGRPADATGTTVQEAPAGSRGAPTADPAAPPAGTRPAALKAARAGRPDDLKRIKGVGPKLEALLNRLGFFHYDQVAAWSAAEVAWVDENLEGFKGRVSRDGWVGQAKILAAGGATEFSKRTS